MIAVARLQVYYGSGGISRLDRHVEERLTELEKRKGIVLGIAVVRQTDISYELMVFYRPHAEVAK